MPFFAAHFSNSDGMVSSGPSTERCWKAAAESWLPVLLNIASDTMGFMLSTNAVISSSVSLCESGTGVSQVFLYLSLWQQDIQPHFTAETGSCQSFMSNWNRQNEKREARNHYTYLWTLATTAYGSLAMNLFSFVCKQPPNHWIIPNECTSYGDSSFPEKDGPHQGQAKMGRNFIKLQFATYMPLSKVGRMVVRLQSLEHSVQIALYRTASTLKT